MVFLQLKGIEKSFGDVRVLKGVDLALKKGEIVALLGRSGSGKSTLLKILVGYMKSDKGKIVFEGEDISQNPQICRRKVGYTTQDNSFYDSLSVEENMLYYANLYSMKRKVARERIAHLLRQVELYKARGRLAQDISGGMKRRLDFALSLLHSPRFVILDEPTTGLDPILIEKFWHVVREMVEKEKITVLVSTHILHEVTRYCSRAAFMKDGKITKVVQVNAKLNVEKRFGELT